MMFESALMQLSQLRNQRGGRSKLSGCCYQMTAPQLDKHPRFSKLIQLIKRWETVAKRFQHLNFSYGNLSNWNTHEKNLPIEAQGTEQFSTSEQRTYDVLNYDLSASLYHPYIFSSIIRTWQGHQGVIDNIQPGALPGKQLKREIVSFSRSTQGFIPTASSACSTSVTVLQQQPLVKVPLHGIFPFNSSFWSPGLAILFCLKHLHSFPLLPPEHSNW